MANLGKWTKKFSYTMARHFMAYMESRNGESQVVALDGVNAENLQTTGTKACWINGVLIPSLTADAEYDISAEAAYAAWAGSQSYTLNTEVIGDSGAHYICILAHTSAAADEPEVGANWETYWKKLDAYAVDAAGDVVATATTKYYLACALNTGVLRLFKAYDASLNFQVPAFDPERYVPLAVLSVANASGSNWTCGTDDFDATNITTTITQLAWPIFADGDLLDPN